MEFYIFCDQYTKSNQNVSAGGIRFNFCLQGDWSTVLRRSTNFWRPHKRDDIVMTACDHVLLLFPSLLVTWINNFRYDDPVGGLMIRGMGKVEMTVVIAHFFPNKQDDAGDEHTQQFLSPRQVFIIKGKSWETSWLWKFVPGLLLLLVKLTPLLHLPAPRSQNEQCGSRFQAWPRTSLMLLLSSDYSATLPSRIDDIQP